MRGKYQMPRRRRGSLPLACIFALAALLCFRAAGARPGSPGENPALSRLPIPENAAPFPLLPLPPRPSLPHRESRPEPELPDAPPGPYAKPGRPLHQEGGSLASGGIVLQNASSFDVDVSEILRLDNPTRLTGKGVEVLIVHTHGTEAYTPSDGLTYEASDPGRTTDPSRSVIRVGDELQQVLERRGIGVFHARELHDYPHYKGCYDRAADAIEELLERYPEAQIILDLHRDAIVSQKGEAYKVVTDIDGRPTAQLMLVSGTDGGGLTHPQWRRNLSLHLRLHDAVNSRYPGLMRPVSIRNARFNQHYRPGSMLLEVGTSGNSLTEALRAVRLFGEVLADTLLE